MKGITAFAIFCEDIRRESTGKNTLIGAMSDTIGVEKFPTTFRRLAVYFRIRLEVEGEYTKPISVELEIPEADGEIISQSMDRVPPEMIERSLKRAKERGLPFATLNGRMLVQEPVKIRAPRKILAILKYGKRREVCGFLNVAEKDEKDASIHSA
jgi:hypothetical protein